MRKRLIPFFLLLLCATLNSVAQQKNLSEQIRHYQSFSQQFAQEKVYLYFDNDNYLIGENIWFKAYVLMADNHHYSQMSKTLYVELLAADGNLVDQLKLRIEDGQCHGAFYLKPNLSAGFYEVRAYTRCMLNFDQAIIFSRVFPVMDAPQYHRRSGERLTPSMNIKKPVLPNKRPKQEDSDNKTTGLWQVDFYPEGGQLVAGRPNQLAFKAKHKNDPSQAFSAKIVDSKQEIVGIMQSEHQGMGSVSFQPEKGENYRCIIEGEHGKTSMELPKIAEDAYNLIVNNMHHDILDIKLFCDQASRGDTMAMLITCRGKIYQLQAFINQAEALQFQLPKRVLPTGVNEILILNNQGQVQCSRLFFVRNEADKPDLIRIAQEQDKENYNAFEAAHVTLALQQYRDSSWIALPHQSFAVSIRDDAEYMANHAHNDVFSQLLLASDLKGYIHQPSWYFEKDDRRHRRALDLLMMVQGWRRYDWQEMSHPEDFKLKHPIEKGILLDGQVLSVFRRIPLEDMKVSMWMTSDSSAQHGYCMSDENGAFNFLFDFEGKQNLNLQVSDGKRRRNAFITINRQFQPEARMLADEELQAPILRKKEAEKKRLSKNEEDPYRELIIMPGDVLLDEVEVKGKKSGDYNEYGKVSVSYETQEEMDVLEDNAMYTFEDIGIFLTQINEHFHFRAKDSGDVLYYKHAPVQFLVRPPSSLYPDDGSEGWPDCSEIERIEIMEPNSLGHIVDENYIATIDDVGKLGKDIAYVILYLYPHHQRKDDEMGIRRTSLQGYNTVKEFYHPRYDRVLDTDASDHRRTLYWNPNLHSDELGQAKIRFYHSASSKSFEVHALVLSEQGKMGWK